MHVMWSQSSAVMSSELLAVALEDSVKPRNQLLTEGVRHVEKPSKVGEHICLWTEFCGVEQRKMYEM